jgi:hypothetical protein
LETSLPQKCKRKGLSYPSGSTVTGRSRKPSWRDILTRYTGCPAPTAFFSSVIILLNFTDGFISSKVEESVLSYNDYFYLLMSLGWRAAVHMLGVAALERVK